MAVKRKARDLKAASRKDIELFRQRATESTRRAIEAEAGLRQAVQSLDAIMIEVAKKYGEEIRDPEKGYLEGYHLEIPTPNVRSALKCYSVKTESKDGSFMIGVFPRN